MWHKISVAISLALLLAGLGSSAALAAGPSSTNTQATVQMQGQASVVYDQLGTPQLRIKAQSANETQWLLEISLDPGGRTQNAAGQVLTLSGAFTLGLPQKPIAAGTVTGWLDANANGDVKLNDAKSSTSLDVSFSIAQDGSTKATAQGLWPSIPSPQTSPAATKPPQPAQPVNHSFWYLSRTAAMIAYVLLFVNICLGLVIKSKNVEKIIGRWQMLDLHQFTALLAMAFIGLHIFSLLGDHYLKFGLKELLIPGASPYRQLWTTTGIIGLYMAIVVVFSFYIRKFIGYKAWRIIHYLSFVLFLVILLHSIMAGTDSTALWAKLLYVVTGTTTIYLFLWRILGINNEIQQKEIPQESVLQPAQTGMPGIKSRQPG